MDDLQRAEEHLRRARTFDGPTAIIQAMEIMLQIIKEQDEALRVIIATAREAGVSL